MFPTRPTSHWQKRRECVNSITSAATEKTVKKEVYRPVLSCFSSQVFRLLSTIAVSNDIGIVHGNFIRVDSKLASAYNLLYLLSLPLSALP